MSSPATPTPTTLTPPAPTTPTMGIPSVPMIDGSPTGSPNSASSVSYSAIALFTTAFLGALAANYL